ncbi:ABC transporter ATP-binding protein [Paracraurococcus ruber]|uniref:ABC transporter ATP-binding protein n=1 Tax=Paracraurococcus ruber TaxID=77675 RepID=UPI001906A8A0|nr:ATP-binding cassette domain-containing protein [Paracraurococcus ruber]
MPDALPLRPPAILDVQDLQAGYGRSRVLFGISLLVPQRGAVAILGRNGVGKTTLMRAIMGELPAEEGRIFLAGQEMTRARTEQRVKSGIAYVPQEGAVFARMSVRENLMVGAIGARRGGQGGGRAPSLDLAIDAFPKLGQRLAQPAGTLSGGERKMVAIGRALLGEPKLLLLDEPTEGVWVGVIEEIADRLTELATRIGVVIVEQHVDLALRVAGHAVVMDRGRVGFEGPSEAVRDDPRLLRYLAP